MLAAAVLGLIAVLLAVAPAARGQDEVLAPLPLTAGHGVRLSAYGNHVVWSQPGADGRHVLMHWRAGEIGPLPVRPSAVRFDVNVGPDRRGRAVAVYSRCRGDAPIYRDFGRCAVYQVPLPAGRERRITRVSDRPGSEFAPAIWRGNIAYASRRSERAPVLVRLLRRGARRDVVLARLSPRRLGFDGEPNEAPFRGIGGTDLTSNAIVFEWAAGAFSELRRVSLSRRHGTRLDHGFVQEGLAVEMHSPNATPRETLWVRELSTPCDETVIVSDRAGRRRTTAPTPSLVKALARDGSHLYAITSTAAPCEPPTAVNLVKLGPLSFTDGP